MTDRIQAGFSLLDERPENLRFNNLFNFSSHESVFFVLKYVWTMLYKIVYKLLLDTSPWFCLEIHDHWIKILKSKLLKNLNKTDRRDTNTKYAEIDTWGSMRISHQNEAYFALTSDGTRSFLIIHPFHLFEKSNLEKYPLRDNQPLDTPLKMSTWRESFVPFHFKCSDTCNI